MPDEKEKDLEIKYKGREKKVIPEIKQENLDAVCAEGRQGLEIKKAEADKAVNYVETLAKKYDASDKEITEINIGGEKVKTGIEGAKSEYVKEVKAIKNDLFETKVSGECSICGAETQEDNKYCTMCGNKLAKEEGLREEKKENTEKMTEKMTLEEVEEFYDSIKEKATLISSSSESLLEKRKKISVLFADMSESLDDERMRDNRPKTEKWREAGNLLFEIQKDIDKNPDTRKEILRELKINRVEMEELLNGKKPKEEISEGLARLEEEKTKLVLLYNELDKEDEEKNIITASEKQGDAQVVDEEQRPDKNFNGSVKEFKQSYEGVVSGGRNPNIPNYLDRRVREIEGIIDNMKKDETIKDESIRFLQKAAKEDIDDMIKIMVGDLSITELYANAYNKSDIEREEVKLTELEKYADMIKDKTAKIHEIGNRWADLDKEITNATRKMDTGLFSAEHVKAHKFLKKADDAKNIAEQKVYLVMAENILDNIEKGLKDKKMEKALQRM